MEVQYYSSLLFVVGFHYNESNCLMFFFTILNLFDVCVFWDIKSSNIPF